MGVKGKYSYLTGALGRENGGGVHLFTAPGNSRRSTTGFMKKSIPTLLFLAAAYNLFAIDLTSSLAKKFLADQESKQAAPPDFSQEAVDNSVDPDQYIVGGGDGFQISIKGLPSQEYFPVVNSDGNIFIGDFGEIPLGRVVLRDAIKIIQDKVHIALGKRYKAYVALKKCKKPILTIGGGISSPGTYTLDGTYRLLDAVKLAHKGLVPSPAEFDLRRIEVRNRDSAWTYDLLRFLSRQDNSQNPYVYPGDHVEIRYLNESVHLAGQIFEPFSGKISFRKDETLADLIPLLNFRTTADSAYFLVRRSGGSAMKVPRAEAAGFQLRHNDYITIPSRDNLESLDTATVSGEVVRKGVYPITWGKSTAAEVLAWAGGFTPDADAKRAFVIRTAKLPKSASAAQNQPGGSPMQTGLRSPQIFTYGVRPEINASLNDLMATNDYAVLKLGDHPESVLLENGDEIHAPRKEFSVYVSGQVRNPGAIAYKDGQDVEYYVDMAGGYARKSDRKNVVVMSRYNEITQFKDNTSVEQGDVIVVPSSIENKQFTTIYMPVLQAVIAVFSVAATYLALSRTLE